MLIETGGKKMKKLLIIYYSWSNGNTERIAKMLQSETDSDILKIDTVVPYSGSYDDVVNQGQNEVQRGYEPEIKPLDINIADYDVIAVGTPTWWYTMAPAVKTFLHQQDFTGKTVVPFMTNGGWPGHVIKDMKAACKGANVVCDMQIQFDSTGGSNLETPQEQINEWIQIGKVPNQYGSKPAMKYFMNVNILQLTNDGQLIPETDENGNLVVRVLDASFTLVKNILELLQSPFNQPDGATDGSAGR